MGHIKTFTYIAVFTVGLAACISETYKTGTFLGKAYSLTETYEEGLDGFSESKRVFKLEINGKVYYCSSDSRICFNEAKKDLQKTNPVKISTTGGSTTSETSTEDRGD